jgi:hypothetical protein
LRPPLFTYLFPASDSLNVCLRSQALFSSIASEDQEQFPGRGELHENEE